MSQLFPNDDPVFRDPRRREYKAASPLRIESVHELPGFDLSALGLGSTSVTVTDIVAAAQRLNVPIAELMD